jgi:hypothetical protein
MAPEAPRRSDRFRRDDIDQSFEALLSTPGECLSDHWRHREVSALFRQIAASYLAPVRDFAIGSVGSPSKEWLAVCAPAVQSLHKSADSMGLSDLARALERLGTAFDEVERLPGALIGDVARHVLENAHQDLARLLPEAFAIAEERDRREPIIVRPCCVRCRTCEKSRLTRSTPLGSLGWRCLPRALAIWRTRPGSRSTSLSASSERSSDSARGRFSRRRGAVLRAGAREARRAHDQARAADCGVRAAQSAAKHADKSDCVTTETTPAGRFSSCWLGSDE